MQGKVAKKKGFRVLLAPIFRGGNHVKKNLTVPLFKTSRKGANNLFFYKKRVQSYHRPYYKYM